MPDIKLDMQTKSTIKALGKRGNLLQIVAAETVNKSAEGLDNKYVSNLKKNQKLRNERYTLGAIKIFPSTPIRKSGEPRQLSKINSIVAVKKQPNSDSHYLERLEH
nr:hypothetical protein [Spirochaetaceae bacterium]